MFGGVQRSGAAFGDVGRRRRGGGKLVLGTAIRDAKGVFVGLGVLLEVV